VATKPDAGTGTALQAETRTKFGKGAARQVRRDHKIPAVLYGHGEAPRHVALPGHQTMLALKQANALLALELEGGEQVLAIARDVQVEPVRREIEHLDLVLVRRGEQVEVSVPVQVVGEAAPDSVVTVESNTLAVTAEATSLPEAIIVDVTGVRAGTLILASMLTLPEGTALAGDPDATIVHVSGASSDAEREADIAESEAELGIEHDAPEAPAAEDAESGAGA